MLFALILVADIPEYSDQIIAAAKASCPGGRLAGLAPAASIIVLLADRAGVLLACPKRDREQQLLAAYADEDTRNAGRVVGE